MRGSRNQEVRSHPLHQVAKYCTSEFLSIKTSEWSPLIVWTLFYCNPQVLPRCCLLLPYPCSSSSRRQSQSLPFLITSLVAPPALYLISSLFRGVRVGRHSLEPKAHSAWAIRPFAHRRSPTDAPSRTRIHLMGLIPSRHIIPKARTSQASILAEAYRSMLLVPRVLISPQQKRHSSAIPFTFPKASISWKGASCLVSVSDPFLCKSDPNCSLVVRRRRWCFYSRLLLWWSPRYHMLVCSPDVENRRCWRTLSLLAPVRWFKVCCERESL